MATEIARFVNVEEGTAGVVVENERGFCVTLWDTDANLPIDYAMTCLTKDLAIAKAKQIANIQD